MYQISKADQQATGSPGLTGRVNGGRINKAPAATGATGASGALPDSFYFGKSASRPLSFRNFFRT